MIAEKVGKVGYEHSQIGRVRDTWPYGRQDQNSQSKFMRYIMLLTKYAVGKKTKTSLHELI